MLRPRGRSGPIQFLTPLLRAWRKGTKGVAVINALLDAKADVHTKGSDDVSFFEAVHTQVCGTSLLPDCDIICLRYSCVVQLLKQISECNTESVNTMLQCSFVDVNAVVCPEGKIRKETALSTALSAPCVHQEPERYSIINALLDAKADLRAHDELCGLASLHLASHCCAFSFYLVLLTAVVLCVW